MDHTVNTHEAKTNLSKLLKQVESGATITIARGGMPIAKLCPLEEPQDRLLGGYADLIEVVGSWEDGDGAVSGLFADSTIFPDESGK